MTIANHADFNGWELTSGDADARARAFVARLLEREVRPGTTVAFTAANSPELLTGIFACLRAGYAPVVLSAVLTNSERARLLDDVKPALVVDGRLCQELARPGTASTPLDDYFHCRPLHFTSGTSGRPKAVWSGWLGEEASRAQRREEQQVWGFRPEDRHLVCAPLSHSAPLRFALYTLLAGGTVVIPPKFDPPTVGRLIDEGITTTFMAPAHLQRLLDQAPPAAPRMRWVAHAGASCPPQVKEAAIALFGEDAVVEFYGSTEGQFTVCRSQEWRTRPGTVGRARPGRALTVVVGQIWCRVPAHARFEYWGDPAKTAATWDGDWFTVGDLGRLDSDGYLYLDGRRSDLIISGGVNVYPAEVESVLGEVSGVDRICVFGIEDPQWGQKVCAVVVGSASEEDIRAHAATHLAPYKRPKTIVYATSLPLTHSGKVDRNRLPGLLSGT